MGLEFGGRLFERAAIGEVDDALAKAEAFTRRFTESIFTTLDTDFGLLSVVDGEDGESPRFVVASNGETRLAVDLRFSERAAVVESIPAFFAEIKARRDKIKHLNTIADDVRQMIEAESR